jgi:hypothetical protein
MAQKCPICNKITHEDMIKVCQDAEDWVLQTIRRMHPEWVEKDGSCMRCIEYYRDLAEDQEQGESRS